MPERTVETPLGPIALVASGDALTELYWAAQGGRAPAPCWMKRLLSLPPISQAGGEQAASLLLRKVGPANADAAKNLAYCLYDICANKRRNATEAASYNGLIAVWSELTRQAAAIHDTRADLQGSLEL
ncbi:MAG: hypothetical protein OXF26_07800 [Alphaproteobacteria bacterium]|nr:hypothetical protein [Alphaproteobacteria bacterium]MCY4230765.1 hypothetical protein [Alphaproteobacteria bacterium]MCY4318658.1 hypothetical protein [Alphaproteobacteria bacterium]